MANMQDYDETARSENGDSTSSELERLGNNVSPCLSGADSPTERGIAKTRRQEEHILRLIEEASSTGETSLDLSKKRMRQFPSELLELNNLEYLYLEGNELTSLPDELFNKLTKLKWLDLRRNYIVRIPSVYTGRHQSLRNLLLEGNNLRTLPLELGLIKSLHGLNISNNPLEFPPPGIIEKGTTEILRFLREMIQAKSAGKIMSAIEDVGSDSSDDNWGNNSDLREYAYRRAQERTFTAEQERRLKANGQLLPINKTVELHRPVSYTSMKQIKTEKLKKAGAMGTFIKGIRSKHQRKVTINTIVSIDQRKPHSATSVLDWKVNPYPEPPPPTYLTRKIKEEKQIAKEKEFNEKTDLVLQRRKDEEKLRNWRMETKRLQQKKYFESLRNGTKDFLDPVQLAPFDINQDYIKIPTNEERIKQDIKSAHEKVRRQVSPTTRQRIEEEKAHRILQLEKRIKTHTSQMHERRKQPKGSPQQEMDAARKDLEVAEALHRELMNRRKKMEYRFKAFVADVPTSFSRTRTLQPNK